MSVATLMIHLVDIKSEAQTKSATGFVSAPVLTTVSASVPARVTDQTADRAMVMYGKYDALKMKRIYFATDPQVTTASSWIRWNGTDYAVTSVQNAGGNLNKLWQVDVVIKPY